MVVLFLCPMSGMSLVWALCLAKKRGVCGTMGLERTSLTAREDLILREKYHGCLCFLDKALLVTYTQTLAIEGPHRPSLILLCCAP